MTIADGKRAATRRPLPVEIPVDHHGECSGEREVARTRGRWTGGALTARSLLKPRDVARAVFHPAWIPQPLDPSVERLKRFRVIAGAVASLGVYTFIEGGFDVTELLENAMTASVVLLLLTPLTVGVMLWVWRRGGPVRQLRVPLVDCFLLLLLFVGCVGALLALVQTVNGSANLAVIIGVGLTMRTRTPRTRTRRTPRGTPTAADPREVRPRRSACPRAVAVPPARRARRPGPPRRAPLPCRAAA